MNEEELQEVLRRIQFNKTEAETLVSLVEDAISKGRKVQSENRRLSELCGRLLNGFREKGLIMDENKIAGIEPENVAVGVDGSFFPVGGLGGLWYVPMSVARVVFENGLSSQPHVDIFDAHVEEIQESSEGTNVNLLAAIKMMIGEGKAVLNWGSKKRKSVLLIDGPIVDPPAYLDDTFVDYRVSALKTALDSCLVVGCVKRSKDKLVRNMIVEDGSRDSFPSDQHLFLYVFTKMREIVPRGALYTVPFLVEPQGVFAKYDNKGVRVAFMFFQKDASTTVLRLDLVGYSDFIEAPERLKEIALEAARNVNDWTYPGQDVPLPVELAHEKCKVRQGCAEVLYDEIMSRAKASDRFGQIISLQLR